LSALVGWVGCNGSPPIVNVNTVPATTNDVSFTTAYDIEEGSALDLVIDPGKAGATVMASQLPTNAVLNGNVFSFTPDYSQAGLYSVTFTITAGDVVTTKTIGIRVFNVIHISPPPLTTIDEGSAAPDFTFSSNDPAGTVVTYSADLSAAPGATFDPATGKLSFTPSFRWLDSRSASLNIIVTAEGQEIDSGKDRVSTAKVVYQINEATSFTQELVPLFQFTPGITSTAIPAPSPAQQSLEGRNCINCHNCQGSGACIVGMDFNVPATQLYANLVNVDPAIQALGGNCDPANASPGAPFTGVAATPPAGTKRVVPGHPELSLWYMKISGTSGDGMQPAPWCGVQMPENTAPWYLTVKDENQWENCPSCAAPPCPCQDAVRCLDTDIACKVNSRLVRKARLWILANAPMN
jgi:hypothetical protein